jgi:hypothetical protein
LVVGGGGAWRSVMVHGRQWWCVVVISGWCWCVAMGCHQCC